MYNNVYNNNMFNNRKTVTLNIQKRFSYNIFDFLDYFAVTYLCNLKLFWVSCQVQGEFLTM